MYLLSEEGRGGLEFWQPYDISLSVRLPCHDYEYMTAIAFDNVVQVEGDNRAHTHTRPRFVPHAADQ